MTGDPDLITAVLQAVEDVRIRASRTEDPHPVMRGVYHHRGSGIRSDDIDEYLSMVNTWKRTGSIPWGWMP